jgi:rhamnopyranosyl-N-acetylglucosaminyl-diphospho-decaprenol beta-1,3/1,4-galactofuranosyltransferase
MRVLAHIHTYNDADVVGQALEALLRQTRPPDAIVLVDNASTDGTVDKVSSEQVTISRNIQNLGPSGAVHISLRHALENGFDWTWVLDGDSVPELDALEKLLAFFEHLPTTRQDQVFFLASWPLTGVGDDVKQEPLSLERAFEHVPLERGRDCTQCDCTMWGGSLFRMAAVARIGLPSEDYVMDLGEFEFGYRARRLGFTSYIVHSSVVRHDVGRGPGATKQIVRLGPIAFPWYETSPIRTYYGVRNTIYFWLYQYKPRRMRSAVRGIARSLVHTSGFIIRPLSRRRHLVACMRGIWDGLTANMAARY